MVQITSSDGAALLPPNSLLSGGAGLFSVALNTAGSQTVTATDTQKLIGHGRFGSHHGVKSHPEPDSYANSDTDPLADTDAFADAFANPVADTVTHADSFTDPDAYTIAHSYADPVANSLSNPDSVPDAFADTVPDTDSVADANSFTDTDAYAVSNPDAFANAYAVGDTHAVTHADAVAYEGADSDSKADTDSSAEPEPIGYYTDAIPDADPGRPHPRRGRCQRPCRALPPGLRRRLLRRRARAPTPTPRPDPDAKADSGARVGILEFIPLHRFRDFPRW